MKKLGQLLLLLMSVSLLVFTAPLEAKSCRKRKRHCCRVIQGPPGPQGIPGPAFNNFVFAYKTDDSVPPVDENGEFLDVAFTNVPLISNWTQIDAATFQANVAGVYLISVSASLIRSGNAAGLFSVAAIRITRDDVEIPGSQMRGNLPSFPTTPIVLDLSKTIEVQLAAGDTISLQFGATELGTDDTVLVSPNTVVVPPVILGTTPTSAAIAITRIS